MGAYNPQAGYQYPPPPGPPPPREDYVPAYDPAKLPAYGAGGYTGHAGDVKLAGADESTEDIAGTGGYSAAAARNV